MQNVVLIGFMGCGKSTLGKKLAKQLQFDFIDSDAEIEKATQLTVSEIFQQYGEDYFRDLEKDFLETIKSRTQIVLSTGGGMPCYHNNMTLLKEIGICFYLKLSPFELAKRLSQAKTKRPLVEQFEDEEALYFYIKEKLSERRAFYELSDFKLNGKQQHPNEIKAILENF